MAKIETQYVLVGRDQTQRAFRSVRGNLRTTQRAVDTFRNAFIALGAAQTVKSIVNAGLSIQRLERSLRVATGSAEAATREFEFIRDSALNLGLELESTAQAYTSLAAAARGTSLEGQEAREIFLGVSKASRALGLSADQTEGALRAIEQIISKGTVQAEELRGQLGERLPGAFQIAARSIGVTTEELGKLLEQGEVVADEFIPRFARQLQEEFGEGAANAANDAQAAFNRLSTAIFDLKIAIAESGVLDAIATFSAAVANLINPQSGLPDAAEPFEKPIERLQALQLNLESLRDNIESGVGSTGFAGELASLFGREQPSLQLVENQLDSVTRALRILKTAQLDAFGGPEPVKAVERATEEVREYTAEIESLGDRLRDAEGFGTLIPETTADQVFPARDILDGAYEVEEVVKDVADSGKESIVELSTAAEDLGFTFQSAFEDAIVEGRKLSEVLQGLAQDVLRIFVRKTISEPLGGFISGIFGGGGGVGEGLPGRALGGPVTAGSPYIVGEKGPELFVPRNSGSIVPNDRMGGSVTVNVINNIEGDASERTAELIGFAGESIKADTIAAIMRMKKKGRF